ncbi:MAG: gliding motility-associated C-terminal domain-containing protein [Endomicrobia bacterium]|nr:gliding motility-associated C-terminal domain-containing protein [Endomicrobiia bacterium]MCL2507170.1 gliding motility-associated C-terminal domain-containing protein [Endomicrobiia bacterium]
MNKKILFTSLIFLFAFCGTSFGVGATLTDFARSARFFAGVDFSTNPAPLRVNESQPTYVLQFSSFVVNANIIDNELIDNIYSVKVQYSYDNENFDNVYSTTSYNPVDKSFSVLVDNIDMGHNSGYYRFFVEYSTPTSGKLYYTSDGLIVRNPKIQHVDVQRISPIQKRIVLKGSVSDSFVTKVDVEYKIDEVLHISSAGPAGLSFTSSMKYIENTPDVIYYKIKAYVDGSNENNRIKYYPNPDYYPDPGNPDPEKKGYIEVPVSSYTFKEIGPDGDYIILDNEDQRYGKSIVTFYQGALDSPTGIHFIELDHNSSSLPNKENIIKAYHTDPKGLVLKSQSPAQSAAAKSLTPKNINTGADITLYYGSDKEGNFQIKYLDESTNKWTDINTTKDTPSKTVSGSINKLGTYAILSVSGANNDYRPLERAFRPGEIIEFRNLLEGDSVTIYDLRGRQVTKIVSGPFVWDGKKSGSFVETGSYIYQIKLADGKIISGSLAFFR